MAYKFDYIERQVYPKTFLKDVRLEAQFVPVEFKSVDRSLLSAIFGTFQNAYINPETLPDGIRVLTADESVVLEYTLHSISIQIREKAYKSFENMLEPLATAISYLEALGVDELKSVTVSKFNELKYRNSDGRYSLLQIMESAFKKHLLDEICLDSNGLPGLTRWERSIQKEDLEDTQTRFYIECGFVKKDTENLEGSLTLKTIIKSATPVKLSNLKEKSLVYNQILDNAFHWCVSDSIIRIMSEQ